MLYSPQRLLLIAGPCMLESDEVCHAVAKELSGIMDQFPEIQIIFKGSFDKANRTSLGSPRGPGLSDGLAMLREIGESYGFPLLTDIHAPEQAEVAGSVVDVLQIPAFLCRQTDLLLAAARTGRVVNVKKGQFLSPMELRFVVEKLEASEAAEIWLTERGTTFGYQNLVVDMRNFPQMKALGHPAIMDATHSVQMPGGADGTTGGKREFVPMLAKAALAAGANGVFLETHPDPENALSDGPNQVPLDSLGTLCEQLLRVWQAVQDDTAPEPS
jgi:2-dehydro-3-deoxyphosphooctonate aldolase (KDO 8-P synthase)